jgi:NADH:ubiquinone oxidoreductase subunit 2 (subunit N)
MSWEQILIMRNELLLTIVAMVVLIAEIITSDERKTFIRSLSIFLFAIVTVVGFFPCMEGSLFGDMFINDGTRLLMKNVLNIGVLIVFIQSASWLKT